MNRNHFAGPRAQQLVLRPWQVSDAPAALRTFDNPYLDHGASPFTTRVAGLPGMGVLLERWSAGETTTPVGRWAIERRHDSRIIGGASILPLPPGNDDLGIAWQFDPAVAAADHVAEIASALASWAFDHHVDEVFAVVRPEDTRTAADLGRSGMRWVGETTKYFDLDLQVYRLRRADLLGAVSSRDWHTITASRYRCAS
jgi:hypothetical protein